jgi:methionyl-tRNA synthetase
MSTSHGGYTLADNVPANEFMNPEGEQNIDTEELGSLVTRIFGEWHKQDVLSQPFARQCPSETKDNDFERSNKKTT